MTFVMTVMGHLKETMLLFVGQNSHVTFFFKSRTKTTIVLTPTMAFRLKTNKIKRKQKKMFQK